MKFSETIPEKQRHIFFTRHIIVIYYLREIEDLLPSDISTPFVVY